MHWIYQDKLTSLRIAENGFSIVFYFIFIAISCFLRLLVIFYLYLINKKLKIIYHRIQKNNKFKKYRRNNNEKHSGTFNLFPDSYRYSLFIYPTHTCTINVINETWSGFCRLFFYVDFFRNHILNTSVYLICFLYAISSWPRVEGDFVYICMHLFFNILLYKNYYKTISITICNFMVKKIDYLIILYVVTK